MKPFLALGGWTLFVWGSRIRNVVRDEGWVSHWTMAVAVAFVAVALCLLAMGSLAVVTDRDVEAIRPVGLVLAVVGSVWWIVRDLGILFADHSVPFKVVHTILAAITLALSVWVFRSGKPLTSAVYG